MLNVYIFFRSMFSQIMPMTHSVHFVYDFIDFVVVDLMFQKKSFFMIRIITFSVRMNLNINTISRIHRICLIQYNSDTTAIFNFLKRLTLTGLLFKEILIHVYRFFLRIIIHEKCTKIFTCLE